jgi:hypothetical protein
MDSGLLDLLIALADKDVLQQKPEPLAWLLVREDLSMRTCSPQEGAPALPPELTQNACMLRALPHDGQNLTSPTPATT